MDDPELQAIRAARLAEMQRSGSKPDAAAPNAEQQQQQDDDMRASMLSQVLSTEARERLSRIRIVRGDRARSVEDLLLRMARSGQIQRKVSEEELVLLLNQIADQQNKATGTKIVFNRRGSDDEDTTLSTRASHDDDDDDFFD